MGLCPVSVLGIFSHRTHPIILILLVGENKLAWQLCLTFFYIFYAKNPIFFFFGWKIVFDFLFVNLPIKTAMFLLGAKSVVR